MSNKVKEILKEAEFKQGGFVYKHIIEGKSNPLVAIQSAVDRMRELHDIEDHEFNTICKEILELIKSK
jgi:hypothetical protein